MNTKLTALSKSIEEEFNLLVGDLISARRRQTRIGEFLVKAKKLSNHGEWIPFTKTLPFNRRQTAKYLTIGNNALLYLESDDTINEFYDNHCKKIWKPQPNVSSVIHMTTDFYDSHIKIWKSLPIIGYVYVLSNPIYPYLKIGSSYVEPNIRALQLDTTGVPMPFVVEGFVSCKDYYELEMRVHRALDAKRLNKKREFFDVTVYKAMNTINAVKRSMMKKK